MLLFTFTLVRFAYFCKKIPFKLITKEPSNVLFSLSCLVLTYIAVFEIDRGVSLSYEVKVSPLYEYSFVFFILGLYHQPKRQFASILIATLAILIILQDFYYGGRITSFQILIVFALFKFYRFVTLKNILIPFVGINLLFTVVGLYRSSYALDVSLSSVFDSIVDKLFINDTAVFAYFASLTHLFMLDYVNSEFVIESLGAFILLIILGGSASGLFGLDLSKGYLTASATEFHWNAGGGVFVTYFYFWFGPYFYALIIILFTWYIKNKFLFKSKGAFFCLIVIIVTLPRWYLYSPGALLRGVFIILPLTLFLYSIIEKFSTLKSSNFHGK